VYHLSPLATDFLILYLPKLLLKRNISNYPWCDKLLNDGVQILLISNLEIQQIIFVLLSFSFSKARGFHLEFKLVSQQKKK